MTNLTAFYGAETFDEDTQGFDLYQWYSYAYVQLLGKSLVIWLLMTDEEQDGEHFLLDDAIKISFNDLIREAMHEPSKDTVSYRFYKNLGKERCVCVNGRLEHLINATKELILKLPIVQTYRTQVQEHKKIEDYSVVKLQTLCASIFEEIKPILFTIAIVHFMGVMTIKHEMQDNPYICRDDCKQKNIDEIREDIEKQRLEETQKKSNHK